VVVDQPVKRNGQSGYVLLVVLLLAGLMVATTAAYARRAMLDWRVSTASLWVHETRESASSGMAFAKQVLASGGSCGTSTVVAGDNTVTVDITDVGGDERFIRVDATSGQLGSTVIANATVYGLPGNVLPTLQASGAASVLGDAAAVKLSGTQTLTGQSYAGTLILARGADITLSDVVVYGAIVSETALTGPPYATADAVKLTLATGARIGPSAVLADCGIFMPDGELTVQAGCTVEVHGVVVADSIDVQGAGSMDNHVVAAQPFTLPAGIDRPGLGRAPLAWPAVLTCSSWGLSRLAFPPQTPPGADVAAIESFEFPAN
jgi:hypothetical protein